MQRSTLTIAFLLATLLSASANDAAQKAKDLLATLTLEEKVGQMTQITVTALQDEPGVFNPEKLQKAINTHKVGSLLNVPNPGAPDPAGWAKTMAEIEKATQANDTQIPILYGIDSIHGASYTAGATLFPQQIGQAATFSADLVEKGAAVSAYETRASSIAWVFSPDLDLPRTTQWPRLWETFGQDSYLTTQLGAAMVRGYQGSDITDPHKVAACIKHFVGYGSPIHGDDRTPSIIPDRLLRQKDLPIYQAAIDAGAKTIMINSGEINGTPVHASKKLLTDILQKEMGFKGLILTDWEDIIYLHTRHKVAPNMKEAVRMAVMAGIDMSMVPNDYSFTTNLIALAKEGTVPMSRIDDAVTKILTLKFELGLFDRSLVADPADYPAFGSAEHTQLAYDTAAESITLLKNTDATLPLAPGKKLLVTGPTANTMNSLNGGWSYTWPGDKSDEWAASSNTILEAFQDKLGSENITYVPGTTIEEEVDIPAAVSAAEKVDAIILCLGEGPYTETPGNIDSLRLFWVQTKLAKALAKTGKPIILVLAQGRPRIINPIEPKMNAILNAYLPGNQGANALVDIITGQVNPSGCLPYNYPRFTNALQQYNHKHTEGLNSDTLKNYHPQFEFGHGLSYTTFTTSELKVDKASFNAGDTLTVTAKITNTGDRAGKHTAQLYLSDHFATITPEVKALKGFTKVDLKPGEAQEVTFTLPPSAFQFVNNDNQWTAEPGTFTIQIGDQKTDIELVQ
ncbi:MAG: glycoside hydrolase family 3 N-terminal domain-containing protein [Verrucomicrobiaceae bacterium]